MSSSKDRAALYMLKAAEARGDLAPGGTIVEATSGNTGISLAALAAARGHRCVIVLPDNATTERVRLLAALGAEVVQTPADRGYPGAIEKAEEIHAATPGSWFTRQHENEDNVRAHYETTGPEIWADTGGQVDVLVCGVGTGGTLTGIARGLKPRRPGLRIVGVEPQESAVLSGDSPGPHRIQGIGAGFTPAVLDRGLLDEILAVSEAESFAAARRCAAIEGLPVGISSGAVLHAMIYLAGRKENTGKLIVGIAASFAERYLSTPLFAGL
jgi:cysteine synthase A